jgi:maleylacetoacetate isomerase
MPGEIVLHDYWRSSASYRVRIALGLAGLTWRTVPVDLTQGAHAAPPHIALNPQGLVPVLEIDRLVLTQSLAILDYLEDTGRLSLRPEDPAARARIRATTLAIVADIHPVCNLRTVRRIERLSGADLRETWMRDVMAEGLAAVEAMLPDPAPHAFGERITEADICAVPQIYNARRLCGSSRLRRRPPGAGEAHARRERGERLTRRPASH